MTSESTRVPVGLKEILMIASLIFVAGGAWTMNQLQGKALAAQEDKLQVIQDSQIEDEVERQKLSFRVESIDKKVEQIDLTQRDMAKEQTAMSRELFEQRTLLRTILEEVKKP